MKCKWQYSRITCDVDAEESEHCIFHLDQTDKPGFQSAFEKRINDEKLNFRGFIFPNNFRLHGQSLQNPDFTDAVFKGRADFQGNSFIGAKFRRVRFEKEVTFGELYGLRAVEVSIVGVLSSARFEGATTFQQAIFRGKASFPGCIFSGPANFFASEFKGIAEFLQCEFRHDADFSTSKFRTVASFGSSQFLEDVFFNDCAFEAAADFSLIKVRSAYFADCLFNFRTDFSQASVDEKLFLRNTTFHQMVDFRKVTVAKSAVVLFEGTNLKKTLLSNTDLEKCEFARVSWPIIHFRKAIFDEIDREAKVETESIQQAYRKLRLNYEDKHDPVEAAHFHIGEMEMRLRQEKGFRKVVTYLYKRLSYYGESYVTALFWLLIFWLVPVVLYYYAGLELTPEPGSIAVQTSRSRFWDSVILSALNLVLRSPSNALIASPWGKIIQLAQMILGPIQITLLLLALRRAYKK